MQADAPSRPSRTDPPPAGVTRVALADGSTEVLDAMEDLLRDQSLVVVVGRARTGDQLRTLLDGTHPDVVVVDPRIEGGGTALVRDLTERVGAPTVVCYSSELHMRQLMLAAGAERFVVKGDSRVDIVDEIRAAHRQGG